MKQRAIHVQIASLRELIGRSRVATSDNLELQSHWAKYLCVLASGFLENAIKSVYSDYASRVSNQAVADYVSASLDTMQNPKTEAILKLSKKFKEKWRTDLQIFLNEEGRSEAIDSIVSQRHLIAHGRGNVSNISLSSLSQYLEKTVEVLEFIESQCV